MFSESSAFRAKSLLRRAYFYRCPYEARAKFDGQVTSSSSLCSVRRRASGPGGSRFRSRSAPGSMRLWSLRAHPGDEPAAMSARALPFDGSLPRVIIVANRTAEVSVSSNRRRYILEKRERKQEAECKRETKREKERSAQSVIVSKGRTYAKIALRGGRLKIVGRELRQKDQGDYRVDCHARSIERNS